MITKFLLVSFTCGLVAGIGAGVAPFLTPCRWNDQVCILKSANQVMAQLETGVPSLGIPPSTQFPLNNLDSDKPELKWSTWNLSAFGANKCQFTKLERNIEKSTIYLDAQCPTLIKGNYRNSGILFNVPIEGEGTLTYNSEKTRYQLLMKIGTVTGNDGKKHWNIDSYEHTVEPLVPFYIKFENLFNGDNARAQPVYDAINANWKVFATEVAKPVFDDIVSQAVKYVNLIFQAIPANELEIV